MLLATATIQISKPNYDVFEAIIDPKHMSQYFIESSTGKMKDDTILHWKFKEMDTIFPVHIIKIVPNSEIIFNWNGPESKQLVNIKLKETTPQQTIITVSEGPFEMDIDSIKNFGNQTEGWANFLACLKAYLEYNINLRTGAFDYLKK